MAPMEFQKLLASQVSDRKIENEIQSLLARKMAGEELNEEPKIQILNDFLGQKINYYNEYAGSLGPTKHLDTILLNELFKQTIIEAWEENGGS